jgi:hypothetical protein
LIMAIINYFSTVVLLASVSVAQTAGVAGSLAVSVADGQGTPIPGAVIAYQREYRSTVDSAGRLTPAPGESLARGITTADAAGGVRISNLPSGNYAMCAYVPGAPYLDPCKWQTPIVTAVSNGTVARRTITLTRGVFLNVHVDDPLSLLPKDPGGPLGGGNLIVGVEFGQGAYLGAESVTAATAGRDYQIAIPAGVPLRLWLFSRDIALVDASGNYRGPSGTQIPFQAADGKDVDLTFTAARPVANTP